LGPGERLCLWTQGCSKNCEGCVSPELQKASERDIDEETLWKLMLQIAEKNNCTGLTVSGGDPLEQSDSLLTILEKAHDRFEDVLVYTGFTINEIQKGCAGLSGIKCLNYIDVLIDGRYVKELNATNCVLRGSSNQKIYYLNEKMQPIYEEYMKQGRIVETFAHNQITIITGILNEVTNYE
jgi:anaerobic ribonucleoside-triphosphate reductase activating protein